MDFEQLIGMVKIPRDKAERISRNVMLVAFIMSLAYVLASGTSAYVMTIMLDSVIDTMSKRRDGQVQASLDFGRRPNYRDLRKAVLDRNIFNETGEFPDESEPEIEQEVERTTDDFDMNARCEKSSLNLALTGTIYQTRAENSLAIIQETGYSEADVYREGDAIIGNEAASIVSIQRQLVVINNSGRKECLQLEENDGRGKNDGFPTAPNSASSNDRPPEPGRESSAGGTCLLEEKYVLDQLGDGFSKIISQARLVPNTTNYQMNGFKIFAIKKDGLWGKVGFKNGDIITQVNDVSLKQPEQGFALYQAFQDEREVRIELLRGGKTPTSIVCRLK